MTPELVVLGNLLVDDVVFPDGTTRMGQAGGAVLYAALGAALWGMPTGVASVRGSDYPEAALAGLSRHGVALDGVAALGRPGLRTWLLYEGRRRQVVHRLDLPAHAEVSPRFASIPPAWRTARHFHIAPMPFDHQRGLLNALRALPGASISLDPYMLLDASTIEAWRAVTGQLDAFLLSEDELAPDADIAQTLRALAGERTRFVAYKRGIRGGLLYLAREDRYVEWAAHPSHVVDATGAGDGFASGLLAGLLQGLPVERALERGIVSASFAIEDWGAARLLVATPGEAQARLQAWFPERPR